MPDFIIDVWRATTLADDAASFVSTVARRLSQRVALQRIALWRVDRPSRSLVTVAAADGRHEAMSAKIAATALTDSDIRRLQAWHAQGTIAVCRHDERPNGAVAAALKPLGPVRTADVPLF